MSDVMVEYMVDGHWVGINLDSLEELMLITEVTNGGNK